MNYLFYCRNYCPELLGQYDVFDEIIKCLEQKEFKQYSVREKNIAIDNKEIKSMFGDTRILQFQLRSTSNKSNIFEEILIFDFIGLVGSIGGSLGLFIGFSFFGYVTPILDAVFDKVASFFMRINQNQPI